MAVRQTLDLQSVVKWFSALSYDEQGSALGEFNRAHDEGKTTRIKELKEQLRRLEGFSTPAHKPPPKAKAKQHASKGVKVPPKYRDKKSGQTWAGRGVQPVWLRERLAKGAKLESFLIAK